MEWNGYSVADPASIISDTNWQQHYRGDTGYIPRNYELQPVGATPGANRFPQELLLSWEEMKERLAELTRKELLFSQLAKRLHQKHGLVWNNQDPSNFCWVYAPTNCCQLLLCIQGEKPRRLSPQSVGAPIKKYQNVGGWGSQALKYMIDNGVADHEHWPCDDPVDSIRNGRKYFEGSRENAAQTKVTGWWEITTLQEKLSAIFRGHPVASGYGWMGHEMSSVDPFLDKNGQWGTREMDHYGRNGMFNERVIVGNRAVGDDMVAPVSITSFAA